MDGQRTGVASRIQKTLGIVALCAPVSLSAWCTESVPVGRAILPARHAPPLAFSQYLVNLREVRPEPVIHAHYDFWNNSDQPVTIVDLAPSCSCLAPQLLDDKRTYQPGERGRFFVSVRSANESPGPKDFTIDVNYRAGNQQHRETLSYRLVLPKQKVSIEPSSLTFYQLDGRAAEQVVTLSDYRGRPIQVKDVTVASGLAEVTVGDRTVDEHGQLQVPIIVSVPGNVPSGNTGEILRIHTDDPDFSTITIPITVFGPANSVTTASAEESSEQQRSSVVPAIGVVQTTRIGAVPEQGPIPTRSETPADIRHDQTLPVVTPVQKPAPQAIPDDHPNIFE